MVSDEMREVQNYVIMRTDKAIEKLYKLLPKVEAQEKLLEEMYESLEKVVMAFDANTMKQETIKKEVFKFLQQYKELNEVK